MYEQVYHPDQHRAADHAERKIARGTFDLTGAERRLAPAVEAAENHHDREAHGREQIARRERRRPVGRDVGRCEQAEADEAGH